MAREYSQLTVSAPRLCDSYSGTAGDTLSSAQAMDAICSTIKIMAETNDLTVVLSPDGTDYGDEIDIPADSVQILDIVVHSFKVKNRNAGSNSVYTIEGYY